MSKKPDRDALTAYLRLLGNPYAKLQILGDEQNGAEQDDAELEIRAATPEERQYARLLGNQYALLSIAIADTPDKGRPSRPQRRPHNSEATADGLSKADFGNECRRIFRPYIPAVEKGRLRRYHRAFIERNQNRPAAARLALVEKLRKYDLSQTGIEARFNREREDLTEEKLLQIERSVLD